MERLILSGSTMMGDRKVYKITMMTNAGTSLNDYYDAETGLKLRRVDLKYMYGRNLKIITDYSDYQPASGVLFPGVKKFQFDIWGDTVNTASRMDSSGEVGEVKISEATYELVKNEAGLTFPPRGKVQAKGKGEMAMLFVAKD